jgi:hypothetical protein
MKGCAYFRRKLTILIEPKIGPVPSLKLWKICAKFMGHLHRWRQARPHWEFAAGLILKAAESARRADVNAAVRRMVHGLRRDG